MTIEILDAIWDILFKYILPIVIAFVVYWIKKGVDDFIKAAKTREERAKRAAILQEAKDIAKEVVVFVNKLEKDDDEEWAGQKKFEKALELLRLELVELGIELTPMRMAGMIEEAYQTLKLAWAMSEEAINKVIADYLDYVEEEKSDEGEEGLPEEEVDKIMSNPLFNAIEIGTVAPEGTPPPDDTQYGV